MGIYGDYIGVYRTPIIGFKGPKYYNIQNIWALKPYCLGPWTLGFFRVWNSLVLLQLSRLCDYHCGYGLRTLYIYIYWGIMQNKMETTIVFRGSVRLCGWRL